MVFIGSDVLIGSIQVRDSLEERILYYSTNPPICPLKYNYTATDPHDISPSTSIELTLSAIITAAIIDSINPCAFAVLILLLIYLTSMGASKRTLKIGLIYILTVFVVYFLSGLGLLRIIQSLQVTGPVFKIAALVSILAGLINVKDFFWYGKGITLAIPKSKIATIEKYIAQASVPAAIVLGILVSLFELPCTGGVYLAILSLIARNAVASAIPYLLLYNLIFVLPLFIILFVVYFGFSAEKADKLRVEKRKWLRLVMGLVMLAIGIAMLSGVFG
jgi:cytochrome c biogenesis protein CcdA